MVLVHCAGRHYWRRIVGVIVVAVVVTVVMAVVVTAVFALGLVCNVTVVHLRGDSRDPVLHFDFHFNAIGRRRSREGHFHAFLS